MFNCAWDLDSRVDIQTWPGLCGHGSQLCRLSTGWSHCTLVQSYSVWLLAEYSRQLFWLIEQSRIKRMKGKCEKYAWCKLGESGKWHGLIEIQNGVLIPYPLSRWHSVVRVAGFKPVGAEKRSGSIPPSGRTFWSEPGLRNSLIRLLM